MSFDNLPPDLYLENNVPPTRLRRFARYLVTPVDLQQFEITHQENVIFEQQVSDKRGRPRTFSEIEAPFLYSGLLMEMIGHASTLSLAHHCHTHDKPLVNSQMDFPVQGLQVDVHQVRQQCYQGVSAHNAPEGIHRDGADYIVSAFVVQRKHVRGGVSTILSQDKDPIFSTTLQEGEGLFHEDRELWHYVEPIENEDEDLGNRDIVTRGVGFRDILGLDITLLYE